MSINIEIGISRANRPALTKAIGRPFNCGAGLRSGSVMLNTQTRTMVAARKMSILKKVGLKNGKTPMLAGTHMQHATVMDP